LGEVLALFFLLVQRKGGSPFPIFASLRALSKEFLIFALEEIELGLLVCSFESVLPIFSGLVERLPQRVTLLLPLLRDLRGSSEGGWQFFPFEAPAFGAFVPDVLDRPIDELCQSSRPHVAFSLVEVGKAIGFVQTVGPHLLPRFLILLEAWLGRVFEIC